MASILQSTQKRTERREAYAKEKKDERQELHDLCNAGIEGIGNPETLAALLRTMVTVPSYTSRNAMLVMQKNPDVSHVQNAKSWYDMGRYVKDDEKDNGIKIIVGKDTGKATFYDVKMVYDVSQTVGKPVKKPGIVLAEGSPDMQKAFNGLVEHSPVPVEGNDTLNVPALYEPSDRVILANDAFSDHETFAAMVNANAHATLHNEDIRANRGQNRGYEPADTEFITSCVTYVVCQRFGVPVPEMDVETPAEILGTMDIEGKDAMLKIIGESAKSCGDRVMQEVSPKQTERTRPSFGKSR